MHLNQFLPNQSNLKKKKSNLTILRQSWSYLSKRPHPSPSSLMSPKRKRLDCIHPNRLPSSPSNPNEMKSNTTFQVQKLSRTSIRAKKMTLIKTSLTTTTVTMTLIDTSMVVMNAKTNTNRTNKNTIMGIRKVPSVTLFQVQASIPTVIPKKATILASRRGTQLTTKVFTRTIIRSSSPIRDERRTNNVKEIASNRLSVVFTQL